jgi:CRP-like cAMP-binding protein
LSAPEVQVSDESSREPYRDAVRSRLLEALDAEDAARILTIARRRRFGRGEVVFHEGDPGDALHLIEKGHVKIRVTTPLGDTALLRVLGPGDFFGELAVISPSPRNATVAAVEGAETLSLHRDHLNELRGDHPSVDALLLEAAVAEVRRLSTQLLEALYVPAPKRVLRRLLEVGELYGDADQVVVVPFTQDDVAQLAGTTRPTTNRVLREARGQGLLDIQRGRIVIADPERLARAAR